MIFHRMTIISSRSPPDRNINHELQWFGTSLGLFNLRDRDKSCFRIFIELVKAAKARRLMTSDEIGMLTGLTRGTVIHHINRLMESGIVLHSRQGYILRSENLQGLVDQIKKDAERAYDSLKGVAAKIDERLGLE